MPRKSYFSTLHKEWLLWLFFLVSCSLSAQETTASQKSSFKPAITEADIRFYNSDKYPVRRRDNLTPIVDFHQSSYKISLFSDETMGDSTRLWSQTKSIFVYGFGVIGVLAILPSDISKWEKEDDVLNKWSDNVVEGPYWDRDDWPVNYLGHPYFGGLYYQVARKSGYRQWDSFVYTALMSSFYWEYGIEAFAEVPSIQDLIVTPVLGWAYGEWAFNTGMDIKANNDSLWGSSFLGSTALVLLDPVDSLNVAINNLFGKEIIKTGTGYVNVKNVPVGQNGETESQFQLNISLQLGDGSNYNPRRKRHVSRVNDPVDTSIIGLSFGTGQVYSDDSWQVNDDAVVEYSLGLYLSKAISGRVSYSKGQFNSTLSGNDINYENYSVDGQYYFHTQNNFRPYITAGFGEIMWQKDNEQQIFQVNAGTGIHYKLTNNFAIQLDWRHYYNPSKGTTEDNIAARFIYLLGRGER